MATGKFVLDKGRTGKFRFNLLSTNGRVVATSEAYESKAAALNGIAAVQKLAGAARIVDNTNGDGARAKAAKKTAGKKTIATKAAAPKTTAKRAPAKRTAKKAAPAPAGAVGA